MTINYVSTCARVINSGLAQDLHPSTYRELQYLQSVFSTCTVVHEVLLVVNCKLQLYFWFGYRELVSTEFRVSIATMHLR